MEKGGNVGTHSSRKVDEALALTDDENRRKSPPAEEESDGEDDDGNNAVSSVTAD